MKTICFKDFYNNAVSIFGFKKVAIMLMSGFTGWCICLTAALIAVPDEPQNINDYIIEKEND